MPRVNFDIGEMAKIVERLRIDRAGSPTLDREIVEALLNHWQEKINEAQRKPKSPLILPRSMN